MRKKKRNAIINGMIFFFCFVIGVGISIPIFFEENPVVWRFLAELIPLVLVVVLTIVFYRFEKDRLKFPSMKEICGTENILIGLKVGFIWILSPLILLYFFGKITISNMMELKAINMILIYMISAFLNVMMQEIFIRGYLYESIKEAYGFQIAMISTTILFTALHGGAFEAGIIAVMNVVSMSIFMTLLLERTKSLLTIIVTHGIWNIVGGILFGVVSLAEDYRSIFEIDIDGNGFGLEGEGIVLVINLIGCICCLYGINWNKNLT